MGAVALTLAATLADTWALIVLVSWSTENKPGSVIYDVFFGVIAVWVSKRSVLTWRRRRAPGPDSDAGGFDAPG
jgi:hypothetical protein